MKKIAIIGAGGINSWTIKFLDELLKKLDIGETMITIYDNDIVEDKNILNQNQNFTPEDLMEQKAESLAKRYNTFFKNVFITEENVSDLGHFDEIILGVDNNKTRKIIYEYCHKENIYLLDLKAQGTQIGFCVLDHSKTFDYYVEKYFSSEEVMGRKGSCQLKHDVENNHIEMGNYIIACFGINSCYLKQLRKEKLSTLEWRFAY